jgi:hypothetical protein
MQLQLAEHFTNVLVNIQEHFTAFCGCREIVKQFKFLLSPYSLIGTRSNMQNYVLCQPAELGWGGSHKFMYCFRGSQYKRVSDLNSQSAEDILGQ